MRSLPSTQLHLRAALCTALVLSLVALEARAQSTPATSGNWNQQYDPYVGAIGLSLGFTDGTGLALRWPALPQTMAGIAGGVWGSSDDLAWNLGMELDVILRQAGRLRLFVGPALAFFSDDTENDTDVNFSAGVGLEVLVRQRLSVKFDLDFTYLGDDGDVFPLPQVALFFYF